MSASESETREGERASVTVVFTRENSISDRVRTVIVPQIRSKHLTVNVQENETQIVFITKNMKLTSLQRAAIQMFPDTYIHLIEKAVQDMEEGAIFHDSQRIYVIQGKPDKKLLVKKIQQIITYLTINTSLCPSKRLFYISNGDSSWDPSPLISVVTNNFTVTHYICAATKFPPIYEDPPKVFPSKQGKPRETRAQSRGERGLQKRYVTTDAFTKLNMDDINVEIEAEEIKRRFKEERAEKSRRHYHTKKRPDKEVSPDDDNKTERPLPGYTASRDTAIGDDESGSSPPGSAGGSDVATSEIESVSPRPSVTTEKDTPMIDNESENPPQDSPEQGSTMPVQLESKMTRSRYRTQLAERLSHRKDGSQKDSSRAPKGKQRSSSKTQTIHDLCNNPIPHGSSETNIHLRKHQQSSKQPVRGRGQPPRKKGKMDPPEIEEEPRNPIIANQATCPTPPEGAQRRNPPPLPRNLTAMETLKEISRLSQLQEYIGFETALPIFPAMGLPIIWIPDNSMPPPGYYVPGSSVRTNPPIEPPREEQEQTPSTPTGSPVAGGIQDERDPPAQPSHEETQSTVTEDVTSQCSPIQSSEEVEEPPHVVTPLTSRSTIEDPPSTTTIKTRDQIERYTGLRPASHRKRLLDDKTEYLRLKAEIKEKERQRGNEN